MKFINASQIESLHASNDGHGTIISMTNGNKYLIEMVLPEVLDTIRNNAQDASFFLEVDK